MANNRREIDNVQGNVLANKSATDRPQTDFYPTPREVTIALLKYLDIPKGAVIWEPACGKGHMAEVMKDMGYGVISSDLNDFGYGNTGVNFIGSTLPNCDWIITNPPFNVSVEFINQCIAHGKPFALLCKSQYWHAAKKTKVFNAFRPRFVLPLTWRPDFLFKGKGAAPTMECLWTVWGTEPAKVTEYVLLERGKLP
jgi:hypothetical protein